MESDNNNSLIEKLTEWIHDFLNHEEHHVMKICIPVHELGIGNDQIISKNYDNCVSAIINVIEMHLTQELKNILCHNFEEGDKVRIVKDHKLSKDIYIYQGEIHDNGRNQIRLNCLNGNGYNTYNNRIKLIRNLQDNEGNNYGLNRMQSIYNLVNQDNKNSQYKNAFIVQVGVNNLLHTIPNRSELTCSPLIISTRNNERGYELVTRDQDIPDILLLFGDDTFQATDILYILESEVNKVIYIGSYFDNLQAHDVYQEISRKELAELYNYSLPKINVINCSVPESINIILDKIAEENINYSEEIKKIKRIFSSSLAKDFKDTLNRIISSDFYSFELLQLIDERFQSIHSKDRAWSNDKFIKLSEIVEQNKDANNIIIFTCGDPSLLKEEFKGKYKNLKVFNRFGGYKNIIKKIANDKNAKRKKNIIIFDRIFAKDQVIEYLLYYRMQGEIKILNYPAWDNKNEIEHNDGNLLNPSDEWFYREENENPILSFNEINKYKLIFVDGTEIITTGHVLLRNENGYMHSENITDIKKGDYIVAYFYNCQQYADIMRNRLGEEKDDFLKRMHNLWITQLSEIIETLDVDPNKIMELWNAFSIKKLNKKDLLNKFKNLINRKPILPKILPSLIRLFCKLWPEKFAEESLIKQFSEAKMIQNERKNQGSSLKKDLFGKRIKDINFEHSLLKEGIIKEINTINTIELYE